MAAVSSSFAHLQGPCCYQPEQDVAQEKERLSQATKTGQNSTELRRDENICLK